MPDKKDTRTTRPPAGSPARPGAAPKPDAGRRPAGGAPRSGGKKGSANEPRPMNIPAPREHRKPYYSIRLVERKPKDGEKPWWQRMAEDPEDLGRMMFERPAWLDEVAAIVLLVVGLVTLFTLLNSSPVATLSNQWSDLIRQTFGYTGSIMVAVMIIAGGVLILLPKIGIEIPFLLPRIVWVEIAFFAFLAVLHSTLRDPEPRALARSGQGGGYVGWALSQVVTSLFGSWVTTVFFSAVIVFALGMAIGIRRKHIRAVLGGTARLMLRTADRMRGLQASRVQLPRLELRRPAASGHVRRAGLPEPTTTGSTAAPSEPAALPTPAAATREATPFVPRLRTARPGEAPSPFTPVPPSPTTSPAARAESISPSAVSSVPSVLDDDGEPELPPVPSLKPVALKPVGASAPDSDSVDDFDSLRMPEPMAPPTPSTPAIGKSTPKSTPKSQPKSTPRSKPVRPPDAERIRRYFTVTDFTEVRLPFKRANVPPVTLLDDTELNRPTEQEINTNAQIIENTLLEFDIDVEVVDVKVGPTVTMYAVQPFREFKDDQGSTATQRVRVTRIAGLSNDLALALSAKRLRIQPFVPGHQYMGIEVPNRVPSIVALRPVMESEAFFKAANKKDPETGEPRDLPLVVPLGREVSGESVAIDLASMPHTLIAGTTGSGKSVCITAIIVALVMNNTPDHVRLVLLDPKMVELGRFNGLPHLLGPVETDGERIVGVLRWATREMERRYKLLEADSARNIEIYNRQLGEARKSERLPYIVILVDEIGDLMLSRPEETERTVTRLAQMARAVGMHLVIATQRPSVDIITGLIKANFPARISFAVASGVDSRVILDQQGAETLMGRGDMLYLASDAPAPRRVQGCYVSDEEIDEVVAWWKAWDEQRPAEKQTKNQDDWAPWERAMTRREELSKTDPMLEETIALVVKEGSASTSLIQRGLNIPYPRAANLMDLLGVLGILGPSKDGGRTREVLLKPGTDPYRKLMNRIKK